MISPEGHASSAYPGKIELDDYLASLPATEDRLSYSQRSDLSSRAWEIFRKGVPQADRPTILYHFYHFLPLSEIESEHSQADAIQNSMLDKDITEYISLLSKDKLYEVCQIRGRLQAFVLRLSEFLLDEDLFNEWDSIKRGCEEYLNSEPTIPVPFLEYYMDAYRHYCHKTEKAESRLYDIAKQVLDFSTDPSVISIAFRIVNNDGIFRAYQKKNLTPDDAKKILALQELEKQVISEFQYVRTRSTFGKALGLLTKEGREKRAEEKGVQSGWVSRIRSTGRSDSPYVHGYAKYLCHIVYCGTVDIGKAIRSLEDAYKSGFDRGMVISALFDLHDMLKHKEDAADWAQRGLDILGVESMEEAEEDESIYKLLLTIKDAGREPQFAGRLFRPIVDQNLQKRDGVIDALEPKVELARKNNIERRIRMGIQYLDKLISLQKCDEIMTNGQSANDILTRSHLPVLLELSLEEIEFFKNAGQDLLNDIYRLEISLDRLLKYLDILMNRSFDRIGANLEKCIELFPNLIACLPSVDKYISMLVEASEFGPAKRLCEHAIERRETRKASGVYHAIRPLQKALHERGNLTDEIALINKARDVLVNGELVEAAADLAESYVTAANAETSLKKKDELLKKATLDGLVDKRLKSMRVELDSLLNRRKRITTWVGIGAGSLAVLAIVIASLYTHNTSNQTSGPPSVQEPISRPLDRAPEKVKSPVDKSGDLSKKKQDAAEAGPEAKSKSKMSPDTNAMPPSTIPEINASLNLPDRITNELKSKGFHKVNVSTTEKGIVSVSGYESYPNQSSDINYVIKGIEGVTEVRFQKTATAGTPKKPVKSSKDSQGPKQIETRPMATQRSSQAPPSRDW